MASNAGTKSAGQSIAGAANNNVTKGNAAEMLSKDFKEGMNRVLSNSQHSDVKQVYQKYRSMLSVKNANHDGGAYYMPGEGVHFNSDRVKNGDMIHKPFQTAFHEFGHNIDYIMGNGQPISESWGNNALYDAIKDDFSTLKGKKTDIELISDLKQQMVDNGWTIMDTASVSDIVESMTGISYPLGVGHGKGYWDHRLPNKEFFAETLDGAASNERSYGLLQRFFPKAVSIVHQIIGGN